MNIGRGRAEIKPPCGDADTPRPTGWRWPLATVVVLLASLALFFRAAIATRLSILYGDSYDGGIEVAILDHWYQIAAHGAAWRETGWFAPYPGTLGYNDTYLIPALFFVAARFVGSDPFAAAFVSHVAMKAIGFLGMAALLGRGLRVTPALSLAGAAIFTTSNASLLHMYHAQLLGVALVPWLALLAIGALRAMLAGHRRAMRRRGIAFALLYGATAFSSFYPLWFFTLFAGTFAVLAIAVAGGERRRAFATAAWRARGTLALLALVAVAALVPLLSLYLPRLSESGGHDFAASIQGQLPIAQTLVNVGPGNWIWGHVLPETRFHAGEQRVGFPPALLAIVVAAGVWAGRRWRREWAMLAAALACAVLLLLAMRWGTAASGWRLVHAIVPGAGAIRVVTRLLLVLLVPMTALATMLLDRLRRHRLAVALAVAVLLAEEVQTAPPLALDRHAQMAMLTGAGPPPAGCDAFFVVSAHRSAAAVAAEGTAIAAAWGVPDAAGLSARYRHNVDAMLLASYWGRPTINGFSTFNPPGWDFEHPDAADYPDRVRAYAAAHPVGRLCGLDRRRSPAWFPYRPAPTAGSAR